MKVQAPTFVFLSDILISLNEVLLLSVGGQIGRFVHSHAVLHTSFFFSSSIFPRGIWMSWRQPVLSFACFLSCVKTPQLPTSLSSPMPLPHPQPLTLPHPSSPPYPPTAWAWNVHLNVKPNLLKSQCRSGRHILTGFCWYKHQRRSKGNETGCRALISSINVVGTFWGKTFF